MNSSVPFDFSIDNDQPDTKNIAQLNSAAQYGWKVKLVYHETAGKNWFHNRGETSHFITKVEVLERNFDDALKSQVSIETKRNVLPKKTLILFNICN
jgi:hypothetical protein